MVANDNLLQEIREELIPDDEKIQIELSKDFVFMLIDLLAWFCTRLYAKTDNVHRYVAKYAEYSYNPDVFQLAFPFLCRALLLDQLETMGELTPERIKDAGYDHCDLKSFVRSLSEFRKGSIHGD